MLSALLNLILGWLPGLLSTTVSVVGKFADTTGTRITTSGAVATAAIQADVAIQATSAQVIQGDRSWWVTAWERPLLFYLCLIHFGAVMLDTTFHFGWHVPAPPTPYDTYEGAVLLSVVVVQSTASLTQKIIAAIWK